MNHHLQFFRFFRNVSASQQRTVCFEKTARRTADFNISARRRAGYGKAGRRAFSLREAAGRVALVLALLPLTACHESDQAIARRVFQLAGQQFALLDAATDSVSAPRFYHSEKGYRTSDIGWWCSGFFPGSLWLTYEYTGQEAFLEMAGRNTRKLDGLCDRHTDHDIGFQTWCSYGNAWRITGDSCWLENIQKGAGKLAARYSPVTGTTRSWDFSRGWQWPVIIDNMMNLELLMQAQRLFAQADGDFQSQAGNGSQSQAGNDIPGETAYSYREVAINHARTTLAHHFRPDGSCFHLVDYDSHDGHVRRRQTVQGLSDSSSWARGQAWALYGFTMMYRESGEEAFLEQACQTARFLLDRLPADGIPYWDFDAPAAGEHSGDHPEVLRDASAGAIMASAFAELGGLTADRRLGRACRRMAQKQVRTLASPQYLALPGENGGFLLRHCVGNLPEHSEIDVALSYADYYFLEAILRLQPVN